MNNLLGYGFVVLFLLGVIGSLIIKKKDSIPNILKKEIQYAAKKRKFLLSLIRIQSLFFILISLYLSLYLE